MQPGSCHCRPSRKNPHNDGEHCSPAGSRTGQWSSSGTLQCLKWCLSTWNTKFQLFCSRLAQTFASASRELAQRAQLPIARMATNMKATAAVTLLLCSGGVVQRGEAAGACLRSRRDVHASLRYGLVRGQAVGQPSMKPNGLLSCHLQSTPRVRACVRFLRAGHTKCAVVTFGLRARCADAGATLAAAGYKPSCIAKAEECSC